MQQKAGKNYVTNSWRAGRCNLR